MIALKLTDILYKYVNKRKDKKKIAEKQIKEDNNNMECECTYTYREQVTHLQKNQPASRPDDEKYFFADAHLYSFVRTF